MKFDVGAEVAAGDDARLMQAVLVADEQIAAVDACEENVAVIIPTLARVMNAQAAVVEVESQIRGGIGDVQNISRVVEACFKADDGGSSLGADLDDLTRMIVVEGRGDDTLEIRAERIALACQTPLRFDRSCAVGENDEVIACTGVDGIGIARENDVALVGADNGLPDRIGIGNDEIVGIIDCGDIEYCVVCSTEQSRADGGRIAVEDDALRDVFEELLPIIVDDVMNHASRGAGGENLIE